MKYLYNDVYCIGRLILDYNLQNFRLTKINFEYLNSRDILKGNGNAF